MKKRIFLTIIIFSTVFFAAGIIKTKAGTAENTAGWLWGGSDTDGVQLSGDETGIGWISMNSANCDTNSDGINDACDMNGNGIINASDYLVVSNYGVNIPSSAGDLSGYAWGGNVGYVAFDNSGGYLNGCPDGNCIAKRAGNTFQGWARFVDIANANIASPSNSGGWLGWIKLDGTAIDGSNYGITIASDGTLSGHAWSDELGWIDFSKALIPPPPAVTLGADPLTINVYDNPTWKSDNGGLGTAITLTWDITGATTCTKSANNGASWTGTTSASSSETIYQNVPDVTYTLTCTGIAGPISVNVLTACYDHTCGSGNTCNAVNPQYGVLDSSSCTDQKCLTDDECVPKSPSAWKEIAPEN